ncbi:MAG: hypothetical protein TUN42_09905 [Dehalogenimonas sp.]
MSLIIIVLIVAGISVLGIFIHNAWIKDCIDDAGPYGPAIGINNYKRLGIQHLVFIWNECIQDTETNSGGAYQKQEASPCHLTDKNAARQV